MLRIFVILLLFSTEVVAQDYSAVQDSSADDVMTSQYKQRLKTVKLDLTKLAEKVSEIVKCYQEGKLYGSDGCHANSVYNPETDPQKSNHADKSAPLTCANNQVQHFQGGSWSCKTIRYLCSNPGGC